MDWYDYLTLEFKLDRGTYRVANRYPFTCTKCGESRVERLDHVKKRIKKLNTYVCGKCRKREAIAKARAYRKSKP